MAPRLASLAASLTILALLMLPIAGIVQVSATEEKIVEVTIPTRAVKAELAKGLIVYPRLSAPAFVEAGGTFKLVISQPATVEKVVIDDGYGHSYECSVEAISDTLYTVRVPSDAVKGVYDLIVFLSDKVVGEPHAVYVGKSSDYNEMLIVHISDRHFGVVNANGRAAANYDLAVAVIALGLPANTIVIDTGDVADTANGYEYMQSLDVDLLLNKPLIGVPGNHDHVAGSKLYTVYRGPFNYTLSIFNLYRIVGIDSGSEGYISDDQAEWARRILESSQEPVTILLFHHPHFTHLYGEEPTVFKASTADELYEILVSNKPDSTYTYIYSSWLANNESLKTLIEGIMANKAKLILVLSGHIHMDSYALVERPDGSKIQYIVTTSTGGSVRTYRNDYHGFRIIKVTADGGLEIYGDGKPWELHASFSTENTTVAYVTGKNAVAMLFTLGNSNVAKLMEKTVLAVHVPEEFEGKTVKALLKGLDRVELRCTPLGCVAYGIADTPPKVGYTYKLVLYTTEDLEPPSITVKRVTPKSPTIGRQVSITFTVSDDSWGVAKVLVTLQYDGKKVELLPSKTGDVYRVVLQKLNTTKAVVTITAIDASGKESSKTITIEYQAPQPVGEQPAQQPTEQPKEEITQSQPAENMTETKPAESAEEQPSQLVEQPVEEQPAETPPTATTPTTPTTQPSPEASGPSTMVIVLVAVAVAVGAAIFLLAVRRS
ncbi:metallophosphoesterase [Hyperthermus butylicus]|uniref:metallophosphoesterase n=1 Tax=Hyperthermus butylicus TaxID=54248 RepID=UPI00064EEEFD|nr:metallophosphoesterase [Hyperthermus butylicus]